MRMPVSSRYYRVDTRTVVETGGSTRSVLVHARRPVYLGDYSTMMWTANSRIDWVAWNAYQDEAMWWVVADANPGIKDWTTVPVGTLVKVPRVPVAR